MATFKWTKPPTSAWAPGAKAYRSALERAIYEVLQYHAADIEREAKDNAPWTDRTANARQSLQARAFERPGYVGLYLKHGVDYGIWLEVSNGGKYQIIMPTLRKNQDDVWRSVVRLLR